MHFLYVVAFYSIYNSLIFTTILLSFGRGCFMPKCTFTTIFQLIPPCCLEQLISWIISSNTVGQYKAKLDKDWGSGYGFEHRLSLFM